MAWDAQTVTFRYADNQDPDAQGRGTRKLLTLSVTDFLQRWLLHVPPPGFPVVRSYGLYAAGKRATLAQCRQVLGQAPHRPPRLGLAAVLCATGTAASGVLSGVWAAVDPDGPGAPHRNPPSVAHSPPEAWPGARPA